MKRMKRLSFQWRITLLTAILIAGTCICSNLLLYRSGTVGIDSLNGFVMEYDPESSDVLKIEFDDQQMSAFLHQFSQEIYDVKAEFGRKCWYITAAVTLLSAAIAYFVSGRALKPLKQFSKQTENINQDNLTSTRFDENTAAEFQQLSCSVNHMLDRLALSFDLQRQFAGNAAHELRTPLAMMQTKLELFAEEHSDSCAETAELVQFQIDQVNRLTALVRTLLEMSNLQSVSRSDEIELAPLVDEILTDLTTLAEQKNITLHQNCEDVHMIGSDTLIYRLLFNLIENAIKYNHTGGSVTVSIRKEQHQALLHITDTGCGIPEAYRETLLVLDGTTGQNALSQAKQFMEVADISGIILTKMDGTAKGGIAVAIHAELGVPVKYIGVGETIDDLQKFNADDFVNALFERPKDDEASEEVSENE